MTAFVWSFITLEYDIEYESLQGNSTRLCSQVYICIANLGKIGLKMCDEQLITLADFFSRGDNIDSEMQNEIRDVIAEVHFVEEDKRCLRDCGGDVQSLLCLAFNGKE